jgi:hypothetical protein
MFILTDEAVEAGIDNISAFIVTTVAEKTGMSLEAVEEKFLSSKTYANLANKETGYYWDSIPEMVTSLMSEMK